MDKTPDELRAHYLTLCEELMKHSTEMRNFAMKPGNAWLAKAELGRISSLVSDIETTLEDIKRADEA